MLPSAEAVASFSQSFGDGSTDKVLFDASQTTGSISFDAVNSEVDILTSGVYVISGQLFWEGDPGGARELSVVSLSGVQLATDSRSAAGSAGMAHPVAGVRRLSAGSSLSLFAEQVSGSSFDTEIVDDRSAGLNVVWVAP